MKKIIIIFQGKSEHLFFLSLALSQERKMGGAAGASGFRRDNYGSSQLVKVAIQFLLHSALSGTVK